MRQNSKKATAAVMRYGYWRGEFFEGCEPRVREKGTVTHQTLASAGRRWGQNLETQRTLSGFEVQ